MDQTAALIFMMLCIFAPMLLPLLDRPVKNIYIEKEIVKYKYISTKQKSKPKSIADKQDKNMEIFNDCVLCLNSLGLKKTEAKERAKKLFEKKQYNSVEDFLMDAYKI